MGPVAAPRRPPCCSCFAAPSSWWCSWSLFHTVTKGSVLISPFTKLLEPQECKAFNWKFSFCHTTSPYLFHRHRHDDPAWWKIEVKACPSSSRWHMITQKWQKKNTAKKRKKKSMDTRTSRIQFLDLNHLWICTDNGQIWQLRWAALEREMKSLFASISLFSGEWFSDRLIEQGNGERRRKPTYPPSCTLQTSSIHPLPKPENQQTPQLVLFFQSFIHFPTWTFQLIEIWRFRRGNVQRITKTKKRAGPHQPGGGGGGEVSNVLTSPATFTKRTYLASSGERCQHPRFRAPRPPTRSWSPFRFMPRRPLGPGRNTWPRRIYALKKASSHGSWGVPFSLSCWRYIYLPTVIASDAVKTKQLVVFF